MCEMAPFVHQHQEQWEPGRGTTLNSLLRPAAGRDDTRIVPALQHMTRSTAPVPQAPGAYLQQRLACSMLPPFAGSVASTPTMSPSALTSCWIRASTRPPPARCATTCRTAGSLRAARQETRRRAHCTRRGRPLRCRMMRVLPCALTASSEWGWWRLWGMRDGCDSAMLRLLLPADCACCHPLFAMRDTC